MKKKLYSLVLLAAGLLCGTHAWADKALVAEMTALEQTTSFYMDEVADEPNQVYASAYDALTAALAALPDNSTPATIKLFSDVAFEFAKNYYTVKQYQNVTIDLNGHRISTATGATTGSKVIMNMGTLIVDDSSDDKKGIISNCPYNSDTRQIPGYGSYTIQNKGTFILNNGTIENGSDGSKREDGTSDANYGGACYCVENEGSATFIMNGGKLNQPKASAVRILATNGNTANSVTINGGEIESKKFSVITHYNSSGATAPVNFTINGGTLTAGAGYYPYYSISASGTSELSQQHVQITGGTINGTIALGSYATGCATTGKETIEISGGTFTQQPFFMEYNKNADYTEFITGGIFKNFNNIGSPKYTYGGYAYKSKYPKAEDLIAAFENFTYTNDGSNWTVTGDKYDQEDALFSVEKYPQKEDLIKALKESSIISGEEYWGSGYGVYWAVGFPTGETLPSDFDKFGDDEKNYIAEGYTAIPYEEGNPATDLIIGTIEKKETNNDGSWATPETWSPENAPDAATDVTIKNEIIVESGIAEAHGVEINGEGQIVVKKGAVLEIGAGGIKTSNHDLQPIIVEAGGTLRVGMGGVSKEAGTLNPVEIYNDGTNSGVFMINPNAQVNTMPEATVTLTTNVRKGAWQHLALPIENLTEHSNDKGAGNAVYEWKDNDWNQLGGWDEIEAFKGYDFTNDFTGSGKVTYTFKGNLAAGNENAPLLFDHAGTTFFGNSYTAPISLVALFEQIGSDMTSNTIEKTAYVYNSVERNYEWTNQLGLEWSDYIPVAFKTIAPMQGFWMNLQNGETAGTTINYRNAIWNNTEELGNPQKAPKRSANSNMSALANIRVSAANGASDHVMLVESDEFSGEFENGSDATKMMSKESFNLYANTEAGQLSMVATDNLVGTVLTFQAGEAVNYTLDFSNISGNVYALRDLKTGEVIAMDGTYSFVAQPNSTEDRFEVVVRGITTGMQSVQTNVKAKGIYTIMGQYLGETVEWNNVPQGVYVVDGIRMAK